MYLYRNNLCQIKLFHTDFDITLRVIVDKNAPLRTKKMPKRQLLPLYNKKIQIDTEGIVSGCGSGPVCVFIMKCSRSVKF